MVLLLVGSEACGQSVYISQNFRVSAASPEVARQIASLAEQHRRVITRRWFPASDAPWEQPCRITLMQNEAGASGWTSYVLRPGRVDNLHIQLWGRADLLLESVLPHEVAHAVLVTALKHPLPRWADEGLAMLCETENEQRRLWLRGCPATAPAVLNDVFTTCEYPGGHKPLECFYAQSLALVEFLLTLGDEQQLMRFAVAGERQGWDAAVREHYHVAGLPELEAAWHAWLLQTAPAHASRQMELARGGTE